MGESHNDVGARIRAARGYARLEPDDLAAKLGFSRSTLDRVEANKRHLDVREAQVIADRCGVPLSFLTRGWWAPPDLADRVDALENRVAALEASRRGTLTRDQAETILSELIEGDAATPTTRPAPSRGRQQKAG